MSLSCDIHLQEFISLQVSFLLFLAVVCYPLLYLVINILKNIWFMLHLLLLYILFGIIHFLYYRDII